jgi:(p)ppGpp synthase/HD superfamily hydrolase
MAKRQSADMSATVKSLLTERFSRALAFASDLHRNQLRKGTAIPYIAHLLAVASIALEHGANEDEAIAALLHDSIEDQSRGDAASLRSRIREEFGKSVLMIVEGCTDADVIPKPPWRERKAAYLAHLAEAPRSVMLVSASDKLHNARSIVADLQSHGPDVWTRFKGGRGGSLWYYRSLAAAFKERLPSALSDQLNKVVSEMENLALWDPKAGAQEERPASKELYADERTNN